jgi:hypothetical protein
MNKDRLWIIVNHEEVMWKQRAKRTWIKDGDKNTRFFHEIATNQKRANWIASLQEEEYYTDHQSTAHILFKHFCELMGKCTPSNVNFDFSILYDQRIMS